MNIVTISGTSTAITEYWLPRGFADWKTAPRNLHLMEHLLFIVARAEHLRHDVNMIAVMLRGLGQLRCNVEFHILIES
jgi:hypothetical protein